MIKILFTLFSTVFIGNSCENIKKPNDKRKVLIEKAVKAIAKYDTIQLYDLIDTSYCFDIYGKDGFLHKVDYVYNRFKVCGTSIADTSIKIQEKQVQSKEYTLPFCRNEKGEVVYDSFDLLFSFSDYDSDEKILLMDVTIHRREIKPTVPVPTQKN